MGPTIRKYGRIITVILFVIVTAYFFYGVLFAGNGFSAEERAAIRATINNPAVIEFLQVNPEYNVTADVASGKDREEYTVIYEGTSAQAIVVQYSAKNNRGIMCVVDNDEVKRCFNNIKIG